MRLKQIKLAGFKSFVDLTKVPFPHQMTAIVGPNGCGKSNIIDAVRWVLGESSAKNLRGDAMTDVIFNGAAQRKAVGQASVELVFDNSHVVEKQAPDTYSHAHELAERTEISVRRQVNRDGQNHYFLNGSKCRRRDITDIFLGTGLGPRSYAIIEQGTISRLIESKPQELRVFIEEAAGISQYKERRRETELKIKHTVENIQRLDDIRFEVEQQLEKLHIQSEAAKQFRELKQNERRLKSELIALQWQSNQDALDELSDAIEDEQTTITAYIDALTHIDATLKELKTKQANKNNEISELQQQKNEHAKHCIVAEENLKHAIKQQSRVEQEQSKLTQQLNTADLAQRELSDKVKSLEDKIEQKVANSLSIEAELNQSRSTLNDEQNYLNDIQTRWNTLNQLNREQIQARAFLDENKVKLMSENKRLNAQFNSSLEQIQSIENQQADTAEHQKDLNVLAKMVEKLEPEIVSYQNNIATLEQEHNQHKQELAVLEKQQNQLSHSIEHITHLLEYKQDWQHKAEQVLKKAGQNIQMLFQQIDVDPDWVEATTTLIGRLMQAPMIDAELDLTELMQYCFIEKAGLTTERKQGTIAEKINATLGIPPWLNYVYTASNKAEALRKIEQCRPYESVICIDGTWYGHGFLVKGNLHVDEDATESTLNRKGQLSELEAEHLKIAGDIEAKLASSDNILKQLNRVSEQYKNAKETLNEYRLKLKQIEQQQHAQIQQNTWQKQQLERSQLAHQELLTRIEEVEVELSQVNKKLDAMQVNQTEQQEHILLGQQQIQAQQVINQLHHDIESQQSIYRQLNLSVEQLRMQHIQLMQSQQHANAQVELTTQQLAKLADEELVDIEHLSQQVKLKQQSIDGLDADIAALNKDILSINNQTDKAEHEQKQRQIELEEKRALITQGQINLQNYQVRCETYIEQLKEAGVSLSQIIEHLPNHVTDKHVQRELNNISKSLSQLGAINLAAIDEYQQHISRKKHLDLQYEDLTQAISTLESAIAKIDQESRQKFKATFERVNNDLKTLFPKVFGGGSAYLALTSEDLLETGVTIMARPPGKKNSTIHLLSGGEKALTALSLVFAIFRLNPAPFCMLDEVDAPLDDANVGRFCNLVREMSQTVQFIFISHNKIAMEMASHLTGVTMFEPGVSRMVSVDIDEAIAMAEVS